jgi:hypothetical protein
VAGTPGASRSSPIEGVALGGRGRLQPLSHVGRIRRVHERIVKGPSITVEDDALPVGGPECQLGTKLERAPSPLVTSEKSTRASSSATT